MKKFFLGTFLMCAFTALAQNIYNSNGTLTANRTVTMAGRTLNFSANSGNLFIHGDSGRVGIGTTSPSVALDVNGRIFGKTAVFNHGLSSGQTFLSESDRSNKSMVFSAGPQIPDEWDVRLLSFHYYPTSNLSTSPEVQFAMNTPNSALNTATNRFVFNAIHDGGGALQLRDKISQVYFRAADDGNGNYYADMPNANSRFVIGAFGNYLPAHKFVVRGSSMIEGNIFTDSNIGIGTSNFVDGVDTYRLSVDGNIRAKRVKVYTTWADYVFEKNYTLPTLEEVEQHIKEKGHLKDIPSAKEVEANGIELGEMNKLLLQKIEELTLYTIELNKEVQALKSQLNK